MTERSANCDAAVVLNTDTKTPPRWRYCDYHVHTYHSQCGREEMQPADIIHRAEKLGLQSIALTDHLEYPHDRNGFAMLQRELAQIRTSVEVLFGCEVTILPPRRVTVDKAFAAQFDHVLCGYNHFHNSEHVEHFGNLSESEAKAEILGMLQTAVDCPFINAIAHPFFIYLGSAIRRGIFEMVTESDIAPIFEAAVRNNVAFEISPKVIDEDLREPAERLYRLAIDAGVEFIIGSDAHALANIGRTGALADFITGLGLDDSRFARPKRR